MAKYNIDLDIANADDDRETLRALIRTGQDVNVTVYSDHQGDTVRTTLMFKNCEMVDSSCNMDNIGMVTTLYKLDEFKMAGLVEIAVPVMLGDIAPDWVKKTIEDSREFRFHRQSPSSQGNFCNQYRVQFEETVGFIQWITPPTTNEFSGLLLVSPTVAEQIKTGNLKLHPVIAGFGVGRLSTCSKLYLMPEDFNPQSFYNR